MKYLKILGLAAIAAAAMMAFAGSASATILTGSGCNAETGCAAGTVIHAESEGKAVLDPPIGKIECNSTVEGEVTDPGSSTTTVKGKINTLKFEPCENGAVVTVLAKGTLEIHTEYKEGKEQAKNNNGTLTSFGTEVTIEAFGFHCIFKTNATAGTTIGTVTGSANTKGNAKFDISATIPRTGGRSGAFCGAEAQWTGSYKVTSPATLNID